MASVKRMKRIVRDKMLRESIDSLSIDINNKLGILSDSLASAANRLQKQDFYISALQIKHNAEIKKQQDAERGKLIKSLEKRIIGIWKARDIYHRLLEVQNENSSP